MEKQLSFLFEKPPGEELNKKQDRRMESTSIQTHSLGQPASWTLPNQSKQPNLTTLSLGLQNTPKTEQLFDNLISVKTVAEMLGVAPKTIHNWVYLRKIPYVKCGHKVMFRSKSLKAWLNRKEKPCL